MGANALVSIRYFLGWRNPLLTNFYQTVMLVKMMRGKVFLTVAGLLLGAAGLALFNFGQTPPKTKAVTGYTTNWVATKVYQLRLEENSVRTNFNAIGVSEWFVEGEIGGTGFNEVWKGPDENTAILRGSCGASPAYDETTWLIGCVETGGEVSGGNNNPAFKYDLRNVSPSGLSSSGGGGHAGSSFFGGAAKCTSGAGQGAKGCVITTGSYGFIHSTMGSNSGVPIYYGLMMPLKWTVIGTIE